MRVKRLGFFVFILVSVARGTAPRDVSALLGPIAAKHDVPGMVGGIIEGDVLVASGAVGVRKRGETSKVTVDDRFHIGSCTKAMTATMCAMLVEDGKLSWDRTLAEAFPELKERMHQKYRNVTLEQLLTNRGGVPGNITREEVWLKLWTYQGPLMGSRQLLVESLLIKPPEAEPGEKFIYSNAGFSIAGHMAERAADKAWEYLMKERIFDPLAMKSAGFGAPGVKGAIKEPLGHTTVGKPVELGPGADNPPGIGPGGIIHCSIGDWAKFVGMHLQKKILKAETFEKLHRPVGDYAMGWMVTRRDWAKGPVWTHAGTNTMWYAVVWASPEDNFAVLVMCNKGGDAAAKACDEAAGKLIQSR